MPSPDIVINTALVGSVTLPAEMAPDAIITTPAGGDVNAATSLSIVSQPFPSPTLFPSPDLYPGPTIRRAATIDGALGRAVITTANPN